ncbi:FadR/GntR family transcriptional regulator, partial [Mycobacterium kansasii]
PLRRTSLADQAADALLARVRSGEWAVGDKLPGETTLAPQLGVGRSTVREAIRRLAGIGVLATRQGAGVFVTRLDAPSGLDVLLDGAAIDAVLEAR